MKNRIISILLLLCMAFSVSTSVFADANFDDDGNRDQETGVDDDVIIERPEHDRDNPDDAYIEDIEYKEYIRARNEYNEKIRKLSALGVWDSLEESEYTSKLTLGEFSALICKYTNCDSYFSPEDNSDEKYAKAYEMAKSMGYAIGGAANGKYSDNIVYSQAAIMVVNMLGYKMYADYKGGADEAYMAVMMGQRLTDTFTHNVTEEMTRIDAAELFEDILDTKMFFSNDPKNTYIGDESLKHYKGIVSMKGIVISVDESSITSGTSVGKGRINIGGEIFPYGSIANMMGNLGCHAEAYYTEDDRELIHISQTRENNKLRIEGADIERFENKSIKYSDDTTDKTARLDENAQEILDYFPAKTPVKEDFENADYVELVDNNNDMRYDVVFVFKYDIMLVERVSESQNKIFGLYKGNPHAVLEVDFGSTDVEMTNRTGDPVEVYYIIENSVLSVAKDEESGRMKIIVSNTAYDGKVTAVERKTPFVKSKVSFDKVTYGYSTNASYYEYNGEIEAGKKYTVFLDYMGRIAGYKYENDDEIKYGYLIRAALDPNADTVVFRMLPYVGEYGEFKPAGTIKVDGKNCRTAGALMKALDTAATSCMEAFTTADSSYERPELYYGTCLYIRQPIYYKTNGEGMITYIDTPYMGEGEDSGNRDNFFKRNTMNLYTPFSNRTDAIKSGGMYLRNTLAFNSDNSNNVMMDTATKVFIVPVSNDRNILNDERNYMKSNLAYFKDWVYYPQAGTQYKIPNRLDAYNVNEKRVAGVMVYSFDLTAVDVIDKKVPLTVVSEVVQAVDDDGRTVTRLIGYQGNSEISVDMDESVTLTKYFNSPEGGKIPSTVRRGDVIRYVTNNTGRLVDYVKVFSLKDEDDPEYIYDGNEYGETPTTSNKTMLAVSDGKYAENGRNTPHIHADGEQNYGASYRLVYGTLLRKNGRNLVIKTQLETAYGLVDSTEIADFTGFNVLCIDEKANSIYVPTEDDLLSVQGDENESSKVIIHTEGGKQRQLIIVKRAKN